MAQSSKEKISNVRYGEIHFYYPIKFDTTLSFDELCDCLQANPIIFTDEHRNKIMDALGYSIAKTYEEYKNGFSNIDPADFTLKMNDYEKYKDMKSSPMQLSSEDLILELESTGASIKFHFKHADLESLNQRVARLQKEYDVSSQFYGSNFTTMQQRFVLLPLKVELANHEYVWLHALLYVFANHMGILKLELPLKNMDMTPLKEYDFDSLIEKFMNKWNIEDFDTSVCLTSIYKEYLSFLSLKSNLTIRKHNNDIRNIILVDFEGMPKQINNIPNEIQEDLYRIVAAPVPNQKGTSYVQDARDYLKTYNWGNHGLKCFLKTTGGCLSIIDRNLFSTIEDSFKHQLATADLEKDDYTYLYDSLACDISINTEFALLIPILKKTNEYNDFFSKISSPKDLVKIRKEYNRNIIFIAELQENCYGSVSEQISVFEKCMPHYLKTVISHEKLSALNNILYEEEKKKYDHFQSFLAIGGLMLSLIFGLPSIFETLKIIRELFSCIPMDIPILTLHNTSVFLWLGLNLFIFYKIYNNSR